MGILRIGSRRYVIPSSSPSPTGPTNSQTESEEAQTPYSQVEGFKWPSANKNLARQLRDFLTENAIPFKLSNDSLLIAQQQQRYSVSDIVDVLQFKQATFNHSYTHFVSIPLHMYEDVAKEFASFQQAALELVELPKKYAAIGHKSRLFVHAAKLHVTLLMVTAIGPDSIVIARDLLYRQQQQRQFPPEGALRFRLKGTEVLRGDGAGSARVLIARVEPCGQGIDEWVRELRTSFLRAHLSDALGDITWHCTLMNGKYFDRFYGTHGCTFDARKVLRKVQFGPVEVAADKVHLSSMRLPAAENGYYHAEAVIGGKTNDA